jgi:hypothetical protein
MYQLKYLFECEFADGKKIRQMADDVSSVDPSKSTIYDVLQYPSEVVWFRLYPASDWLKCSHALHLPSGTFYKDGAPCSEPTPELPVDAKRRLIYYRLVKITHFAASLLDREIIVKYNFGWQALTEDHPGHTRPHGLDHPHKDHVKHVWCVE